MKRLRIQRWNGSFQPPRNPRLQRSFSSSIIDVRPTRLEAAGAHQLASNRQTRCISSSQSLRQERLIEEPTQDEMPLETQARQTVSHRPKPFSSDKKSSKLAALHARLSLPARLPLATLARCLVDATTESSPEHNNASLAILGQELLSCWTAEWLLCHYPRLPMSVFFAAQYAYIGPKTLSHMRREWGVEPAAAPGEEVDPGLLQFKRLVAGNTMDPSMTRRMKDFENIKMKGTGRPNEEHNYRRGLSSRIVYDDPFGDLQTGIRQPRRAVSRSPAPQSETDLETAELATAEQLITEEPEPQAITLETASSNFVKSVFGALYLHAGKQATQSFHKDHILSRHLKLDTLFDFKYPTRDLSRLCAREGFDPPVARLISETGRESRTPVFVVGVFSGEDKLGEDAGASLNEGRVRAAAAALRSWYLYSPPEESICLPSRVSEIKARGARWRPQMIDIGEVVT